LEEEEEFVADRECPDCGVWPGREHDENCDVARCMATGRQRLSCFGGHDCGQDVWTGEWPGDVECREFGWWVQDRCAEGMGWLPCAPDDPGAVEDLNRLSRDAVWSPERRRWLLRATS
jgi:hypothetical protein